MSWPLFWSCLSLQSGQCSQQRHHCSTPTPRREIRKYRRILIVSYLAAVPALDGWGLGMLQVPWCVAVLHMKSCFSAPNASANGALPDQSHLPDDRLPPAALWWSFCHCSCSSSSRLICCISVDPLFFTRLYLSHLKRPLVHCLPLWIHPEGSALFPHLPWNLP